MRPDPCSPEAGALLRTQLLQPGGAKEAYPLVRDLFKDEMHGQVLAEVPGGGHYPTCDSLLRHLGLER